jgi:hypothetical protein
MSKGRQDAGPEWCAICKKVRSQLLIVCPLSNRRFTSAPGTFRRQEVAWEAGVSLANLSRMMDEQLPSSPDTITRLAKFLGMRVFIDRIGPLPQGPDRIDGLLPRSKKRRKAGGPRG